MDEQQSSEIINIIKEILAQMGVESTVEAEDGIRGKIFNISSRDSNLLIGQRGANLSALQYLAQAIAYKRLQLPERFMLDVDDYRRKREWYLRETAKKAIEQIRRTHRAVMLEPMPAYERRVIHAYLSEEREVETESVGKEPNRRIVIKPKERGSI